MLAMLQYGQHIIRYTTQLSKPTKKNDKYNMYSKLKSKSFKTWY